MNDETVFLIERPYQDIVDDILTAMVGGIVNEPLVFDLKSDLYPLAQPAQALRGITGAQAGLRHTFQPGIDFAFEAAKNAVVWLTGGTWPDDESTFYVDYFPVNGGTPLTDVNVGSVTRTLGEAVGREIATVYEQINRAYLSAFIDTATGKSLDLVVAILGVTRKTADYAVGLATFFRDPAIVGNITIPEGTALATGDGIFFETTQLRTLQRGQIRIDVPIRAANDYAGEEGRVDSGQITQLAQPIAGISRVTNFEPTFLGAEDESDEELRARAKAVLRALGKGTIAALARVIFEGRGVLSEVWDPNSPPDRRAPAGTVTLLVESEPERFPSLRAAVEETRAAGVLTTLVARYIYFTPRMVLSVTPGLPAAGKVKLVEQVIAAMQSYVDGLSSGEAVEGEALLAAITAVDDVGEATIVDVLSYRSDLGAPGPESLVDALMQAIQAAPTTGPEQLQEALTQVVTEESALLLPTGRLIPDRSLVQGPAGAPATDAEIEAGTFAVVATVDGEPWWVVLDVDQADIVLQEI